MINISRPVRLLNRLFWPSWVLLMTLCLVGGITVILGGADRMISDVLSGAVIVCGLLIFAPATIARHVVKKEIERQLDRVRENITQ
jgi:hypothetical protein